MNLRLLLIIFMFSFGQTAFAASFPWLVQVRSTYKNELSNNDVTMSGAGFIAEQNGRYFVICDSHLSQGYKDLQISIGKRKLNIKPDARLADNDRDIEVIEIENPGVKPVFRYNFGFYIRTDEIPEWNKKKGFIELAGGVYAPIPYGLKNKPKAHENPVIYEQIEHKAEWIRARGDAQRNWNDDEDVADSKIVEGMSGAPILSLSTRQGDTIPRITVQGLTKAYHRHFDRSYFSSSVALWIVMNEFLTKNGRGYTSSTRWKFRGMTYRDYGNGTLEINPNLVQAGSISRGDGGNGSGGDGGDPGKSSFSAQSELKAGMIYEGQSTLAFEMSSSKLSPSSFTVYANPSALRYFDHLRSKYPDLKLTPIHSEQALISLLKKRLSHLTLAEKEEYWTCYIDPDALERGIIRIALPRSLISSQRKFVQLNSGGRVHGTYQTKFEPIVKLEDPITRDKMIIDLKGLFFLDVDHATYSNEAKDFIAQYKNHPYVIYRQGTKAAREWPYACLPSRKVFQMANEKRPSECKDPAPEGATKFMEKNKFATILENAIEH